MEDERYRTMSEKYMTTMKKKDLNIELSQTYNKIINFKKINIGFGKVIIFTSFNLFDSLSFSYTYLCMAQFLFNLL